MKSIVRHHQLIVFTAYSLLLCSLLFTIVPRTHAVCGLGEDDFLCLEIPPDFCMEESKREHVDVYLYGTTTYDVYPYQASADLGSNIWSAVVEPSSDYFNSYPENPNPVSDFEVYTFELNAPEVQITDGDNGTIEIPITIYGDYDQYISGSGWGGFYTFDSAELRVQVDHVNVPPHVDIHSTNIEEEVSYGELIDIPVSITISDHESNSVNLTYEISSDSSFTSIIDSKTGLYNITTTQSGVEHTHTFSSVSAGEYYWRIRYEETDAAGVCTGTSEEQPPNNHISVIAGTDITVIEIPSPTATPTNTPTSIPTPTNSPTAVPTSTPIPTNTPTPGSSSGSSESAKSNSNDSSQKTRVIAHIFFDENRDGVHQADYESNLSNITVSVEDSSGTVKEYSTDNNGRFTADVPTGAVSIDVDENDEDMPHGVHVTTIGTGGTDPQTITVALGQTEQYSSIGYGRQIQQLPNTGMSHILMVAYLAMSGLSLIIGGSLIMHGVQLRLLAYSNSLHYHLSLIRFIVGKNGKSNSW